MNSLEVVESTAYHAVYVVPYMIFNPLKRNWVTSNCTVSLSVFAGSERILRRFSIFTEDPCKSTITTSEPCSPVFKEAQPRPSSTHNQNFSQAFQSNLIVVHNVFLLLVIYCCNKASNRIVPNKRN